jgi:hypothetical protein
MDSMIEQAIKAWIMDIFQVLPGPFCPTRQHA